MNARECGRLIRKIATEPGCRVTGTRRYRRGSYGIDVVDTVTGYPFVVHSREDWDIRGREATFWQEYEDVSRPLIDSFFTED